MCITTITDAVNTKTGSQEMRLFGPRYEIHRAYFANGYSEYVRTFTWYGRLKGINRVRKTFYW